MKRLAMFLAALLVALMFQTPASGLTNDEYEARIRNQINSVRDNHGLVELGYGPCVDRYSERWALHLKWTDGFYHRNMSRIIRGCDVVKAGEVLAMGKMKPRRAVRLWMHSPGHRKIITDPDYDRIGVGVRWHNGKRIIVANLVERR